VNVEREYLASFELLVNRKLTSALGTWKA